VAFWQGYPRKVARAAAAKAWRASVQDPELVPRILAAVAAQRRLGGALAAEPRYIPYAATWLRGRRWDDPAAPGGIGAEAWNGRTAGKVTVPLA
jgi:hypothetical protein